MKLNSVTGPLLPQEVKRVDKKTQDSNADREPTSQGGDSERQRHKMTDEELEKALEYLRGLKGIQENGLLLRVHRDNETLVVFVEDSTGHVVRRISETDLWFLTKEKDKSKGNLLDRTG